MKKKIYEIKTKILDKIELAVETRELSCDDYVKIINILWQLCYDPADLYQAMCGGYNARVVTGREDE